MKELMEKLHKLTLEDKLDPNQKHITLSFFLSYYSVFCGINQFSN
jgi:hypothetical protein